MSPDTAGCRGSDPDRVPSARGRGRKHSGPVAAMTIGRAMWAPSPDREGEDACFHAEL